MGNTTTPFRFHGVCLCQRRAILGAVYLWVLAWGPVCLQPQEQGRGPLGAGAGPNLRRLPQDLIYRQPLGSPGEPRAQGVLGPPSWNESGGRMRWVMLGLSRTEE